MTKREYRFDNAKFILILLVVFGHILEHFQGRYVPGIYRTVYLFHMPMFIFISGYFAKFDRKKILFKLIIPFVIFHLLLTAFHRFWYSPEILYKYMPSVPIWTMWYLVVIIIYHLILPFFDTDNPKLQTVNIIAAFAISLISGYDGSIAYLFALSRVFTFLPVFLLGYYAKKNKIPQKIESNKKLRLSVPAVGLLIAAAGILYAWKTQLNPIILRGCFSYEYASYNPLIKLITLFIGLGGVLCIFILPNKKIPIVSTIGSNTLPIYCMHGLVIRTGAKLGLFNHTEMHNFLIAGGLTLLILLAFGNKYSSLCFYHAFTGKFITDRMKKKEMMKKEEKIKETMYID